MLGGGIGSIIGQQLRYRAVDLLNLLQVVLPRTLAPIGMRRLRGVPDRAARTLNLRSDRDHGGKPIALGWGNGFCRHLFVEKRAADQ